MNELLVYVGATLGAIVIVIGLTWFGIRYALRLSVRQREHLQFAARELGLSYEEERTPHALLAWRLRGVYHGRSVVVDCVVRGGGRQQRAHTRARVNFVDGRVLEREADRFLTDAADIRALLDSVASL